MKRFFVFQCSNCQNFTTAPVEQKRRRCSYCGKIIDISKAAKALVEDHQAASIAVRAYNAARGGDEFEKAVDRSRERIRQLVPLTKKTAEEIATQDVEDEIPSGRQAKLRFLLEKHAAVSPLSLTELEDHCSKNNLDWSWVEKQLTLMANAGALIFPRPWTVQAVRASESDEQVQPLLRDVTQDILKLLGTSTVSVESIIAHFQSRGISRASVENSLNKLMRSGDIFEPSTGQVRVI
ncbi:MAG: hypothetical protein ACFFD3_12230 [Candidatus Thorarchaeota archaeon]